MTDQTAPSKDHGDVAPGKGVRRLTLEDQLPDCRIVIGPSLFEIEEVCRNADVVDIGCGFGRYRPIVEGVGGTWVGVEPFEGGAQTVLADADDLPFEDNSFDVAIMQAVMEHLPNPDVSVAEVARVLRPGGVFIGYVAFMECFHEISYFHVSFKGLEHLALKHGLVLEAIAGWNRFGIDYHTAVLLSPMKFGWGRAAIASAIRGFLRLKSLAAYWAKRLLKREPKEVAAQWAKGYYELQCLRQSNGFDFMIRKPVQG